MPKNLKQISQNFFEQDSVVVAKNLIGKILTFHSHQGTIRGIINETEAYHQNDKACHAYGGKKTPRNSIMFLSAGHVYIYFTYGMHYCFNIVTEKAEIGCAVLIRSIIPLEGLEILQKNRSIQENRHFAR